MARLHLGESRELDAFSEGLQRFRAQALDLSFGSRSEAACAYFLSQYGNGWEPIPGVTIQVPAGPKRIDFFLPAFQTYLEFHPIKRYDWQSSEASHLYGEHFRKLNLPQQRGSWEAVKAEFAHRYYKERRLVLDLTGHKRDPLIVAESSSEFYRQVLRGLFSCPLSERDFSREWASFVSSC